MGLKEDLMRIKGQNIAIHCTDYKIYEFDAFCKIDIPIKVTDETINELLDEKFGKGEWTR